MDNEKQIYTEIYLILSKMGKEFTDKLPEDLKRFIYSKADLIYPFRIDELLPESKALIAAIIDRYNN